MLETELAKYISVLESSASACNRAEDRGTYQAHLAEAAKMFAALAGVKTQAKLLALIEAENRAYGLGYLSGEPGNQAELAFQRFAAAARRAVAV